MGLFDYLQSPPVQGFLGRFAEGLAAGDSPFSKGFAGSYLAEDRKAARKRASDAEQAAIDLKRAQIDQAREHAALYSAQTQAAGLKGRQENDKQRGLMAYLDDITHSKQVLQGPTQDGDPLIGRTPRAPTIHEATLFKGMGGADLLDAAKLGVSGVKQDPGSYYINPTTGQRQYVTKLQDGMTELPNGTVGMVPGFLGASAAINAANEDAKAGAQHRYNILRDNNSAANRPIKTFDKDTGAEVYSDELSVTTQGRGGVQSRPTVPNVTTAQPISQRQPSPRSLFAPQPGDTDRASIYGNELLKRQAVLNTQDPAARGRIQADIDALRREISRLSPQEAARALEIASGKSQQAITGQPAQTGGNKPFQAGPSLGQQNATKSVQAMNESFIRNDWEPTLDAGRNASRSMANIAQARAGLEAMGRSGWSTELQASAANVLAALGHKEANKFATGAQMFQNAMMNRVNEIMLQHKGTQTEGDAKRAQQLFIQFSNTPQANAFLMDLAEAVNRREIMKANFYRQNREKHQSDLSKLNTEWINATNGISVFDDPVLKKWGVK